jgi:uncharacterized HAD superfamily protein
MKLGFDVDDIVAKASKKALDVLSEKFNINWSLENFTVYKFSELTFVADDGRNEEIRKHLIEILNDSKFQLDFECDEEAADYIKRWKKEGHSIHFITTRYLKKEEFTAKWLRKYNIPFDSIHHTGKTYEGGMEKGAIGRKLNLDFYIDDREEHLMSMLEHKAKWRKGLLLMDKPWNRYPIISDYFIRVYNWEEVSRHLGIHKR